MSVILAVYSEVGRKEYVLPAVRNEEIEISIDGRLAQVDHMISLRMENIDGNWYYLNCDGFMIRCERQGSRMPVIHHGTCQLLSQRTVRLSILSEIKDTAFTAYLKYQLPENGEIRIGSDLHCDIRYSFRPVGQENMEYISHFMASLVCNGNFVCLVDHGRNGIFLNDIRVQSQADLKFGDHISIWGLDIIFLGPAVAIRKDKNLMINSELLKDNGRSGIQPVQENHTYARQIFRRTPRNLIDLPKEPVTIDAPPQPQEPQEMSMLAVIGPSLTMAIPMSLSSAMAIIASRIEGTTASIFMYTGIVTAITSALVGCIWAVVNMKTNRKKEIMAENRRFDAYSTYLSMISDRVRQMYEETIQGLNEMYPPASKRINGAAEEDHSLWNRNASHEDFLKFRLGKGDLPFQVPINIPKEKFSLINDSLADKPQLIHDSFQTLHDVPVTIDLQNDHVIGVLGKRTQEGIGTVRNIAAQIAVNNSYTDVKMVFLYHENLGTENQDWTFARWLPHVWSPDQRTRYVAVNEREAGEVLFEIANVLRERREGLSLSSHNEIYKPHYVLFAEDEKMLENQLISSYLYDVEHNVGTTTILMAESMEELPNCCENIIENDMNFHGVFRVRTGEKNQVVFDTVSSNDLNSFARRIADLEVSESESGGEIPSSITFFDMYHVRTLNDFHVQERWKKNRTYKSMNALIGLGAGGKPCYLNIHEKYHGPHGLVAGTTGSGKSETLQTYILSLALNFSPDDVGFFIIDYKGGGMANLFEKLPHMLGSISNLSGSQVYRAMVSIKSENTRRQRIFNEAGVNNINAYTQLFKNGEVKESLPHLFIVIDEFAELKREQPDFMRQLISVAQVGRSLGVHLILATQKPAGSVDDNIWSNARFRLCLRVQDRQDSMDMLHKPDAAFLTQAGRCYLQVGNDELYELFQSGWSGAVYEEDTDSAKEKLAVMMNAMGHEAITGSYRRRQRQEERQLAWLNTLEICREKLLQTGIDGQFSDFSESEAVERIFDALTGLQIEYDRNDFNRKAMMNFLHLAAETEGDAVKILKIAREKGIKLPQKKEKTQLDAIVDYLNQQAAAAGIKKPRKLWLPVLPGKIYLSDLEGWRGTVYRGGGWPSYPSSWRMKTMIGQYDDPENQLQMPAEIDFSAEGNYAVLGIGMSGKSTLLQTIISGLIQRYSPDYLNLYIIDFSHRMLSSFMDAPHTGGILFDNDLNAIGKLIYMLEKMIAERKKIFQGGNYTSYIRANGVTYPRILVVIDNYASFREKTENAYEDSLLHILKECNSYGIYYLIAAAGFDTSEIPGRMRDTIHGRICLEMPDRFAYSDCLGVPMVNVIPDHSIAGRGLISVEGRTLEFQSALNNDSADDYERMAEIKRMCREMAASWKGSRARQIPVIPNEPDWNTFRTREDTEQLLKDDRHLPYGYDRETAGILSVDLSNTYTWIIQGRYHSGRHNLMKVLMLSASTKGGTLVLFGSSSEMKHIAEQMNITCISDYENFDHFMIQSFVPLFKKRNQRKKQLETEGLDSEEIYQQMLSFVPYYIFIDDLSEFMKMLYSAPSIKRNWPAAFGNLLAKGAGHRIYFFALADSDKRIDLVSYEDYQLMTRDRNGIQMGGSILSQHLFDFSGMPISEQSTNEKSGIGAVPPQGDETYHWAVIPNWKERKK